MIETTVSLRSRRVQPFGPAAPSCRHGLSGPSDYFYQQSDGSYSVNTDAVAGALASKDPSFTQALTKGLVAGLEIETIVTLAMGAVSIAATEGIGAATTLVVTATTGVGTAAGASAASTLTTAGAAASGAVLAIPFVIAAVAVALWPAKAGPGCCGTDTSQAYGTCDPSEWAWVNQAWREGNGVYGEGPLVGFYPPAAPGSPEEFIDATIAAVFNKADTCWSIAPPLGPVLTAATKAWNDAHSSSSTRVITRTVNNTVPGGTFGGQPQPDVPGQPQDSEPISVAMNMLAMCGGGICGSSQFPPDVQPPAAGATMTIEVNTGPLLNPSHVQTSPGSSSSPSSSSGVSKVLVVAGATAAVCAGGLYAYAEHEGLTMGQALKRIVGR